MIDFYPKWYVETDWTRPTHDLRIFDHRVMSCSYIAKTNKTAVYVEGDLTPYFTRITGWLGELHPIPIRIERNGRALIVWWNDGTKTVVKLHDEEWDTEKGLAMALTRKLWGRSKTVKYTKMLREQEPRKC